VGLNPIAGEIVPIPVDAARVTAFGRVLSTYQYARNLLASSLVRRSAVYTASQSLSALTNFILLPVLTRYLSLADYGIIETFLAVVMLLTGVIGLGTNTSLTKDYFKLQEQDRSVYIGNSFGLIGAAGLLISGALIIRPTNALVADWLKIPAAAVAAIGVVAFAKAAISLTQTLFQLQRRAKTYALFTNSLTVGELLLSIVLIAGLGLHWSGRLLGIVPSYTVAALITFIWLKRSGLLQVLPLKFDGAILKSALPLVVAHVSGWSTVMADRLIVSHLLGPGATGLYALGPRFAMVIMLFQTSFSLAWLPFFYENLAKNTREAEIRIVKATYLYSLGLISFSLMYGVFSRFLLYVMVDKRFYGASNYIFLLSLAYCADGIWKLFLGYLLHHDKATTYALILCVASVIDVGLNFALVLHFGPIGAAWGTLVSLVFGMIATIFAAAKLHKMPWSAVFWWKNQQGAAG